MCSEIRCGPAAVAHVTVWLPTTSTFTSVGRETRMPLMKMAGLPGLRACMAEISFASSAVLGLRSDKRIALRSAGIGFGFAVGAQVTVLLPIMTTFASVGRETRTPLMETAGPPGLRACMAEISFVSSVALGLSSDKRIALRSAGIAVGLAVVARVTVLVPIASASRLVDMRMPSTDRAEPPGLDVKGGIYMFDGVAGSVWVPSAKLKGCGDGARESDAGVLGEGNEDGGGNGGFRRDEG